MSEYADFRQRLDSVLRTEDVQQVREFLVGQGQWSEGTPADPDFAMWMMIAGSPTLRDMHGRAGAWLVAHGYAAEAEAVLGKGKKQQARPSTKRPASRSAKKHPTAKRGR